MYASRREFKIMTGPGSSNGWWKPVVASGFFNVVYQREEPIGPGTSVEAVITLLES
jgi:hypothetical protein